MNNPEIPTPATETASHAEIHSMAFATLVMQQSNMALLLSGAVPDPQTGKKTKDLETAQLIIDQLEMLEEKTKGNLKPEEAGMLKHALMTVRMAFVQAVNAGDEPAAAPEASAAPPAASEAAPGQEPATAAEPAGKVAAEATVSDDSKKRFSKKY